MLKELLAIITAVHLLLIIGAGKMSYMESSAPHADLVIKNAKIITIEIIL